MANPLQIKSCMTTDVITVSPQDDIFDVVEKLAKHRVSGAPVVEDDRLVGMITEKDCMKLLASGFAGMIPEAPVDTFMSRDVVALTPETTLFEVASRFLSGNFRRFPVVKDGALVGIVSRHDVMRTIHKSRGPERSVVLHA
jgi:CBS domain-containing protein